MDTSNHKFDEMLIILDETFNHLKAQSLIANAYDLPSKKINMIFQWVFDQLDTLKLDALLASDARSSHARGGERSIQWKPISKHALRYENSDK